jgi:DNA-binding CsgD family transcriptional regulator
MTTFLEFKNLHSWCSYMDQPLQGRVTGENPLYRRVFIGREGELKQMESAFEGAVSGQGALMMVTGEPGIGKTALCEQLAAWVSQHGGHTLVGYCYEEGSRSLPYLAFIEALRPYVVSREAAALQKELGPGAADLARIIPEIRERLKVEPRIYKDPDEGRYQLMQAVTDFLSRSASIQPLLMILEDLHDADKGTLDMLTYVTRHLKGTRLLVVGTYRDVEVDRTHPLSAALAELRKVSNYGRVLLRGLSVEEVRRMLESVASQEVPFGLAQAVNRQTEGNPLFVQEVIRYLYEEGLTRREGEGWKASSGTQLEMSIPEGLKDVIGKRLSRLSNECNQLLSVASVIGREFGLETLKNLAGIPEDIFFKALQEAVHLSILEERSQVGTISYRFTHAFFRQTLYLEMIAPQRLQLHQQVARTLETQYANRLEEHAAELAEHFSQSTEPTYLEKAVKYSEMAAKRARDVYAYGEEVRLLDQALKVQRVLNPDDKGKICDLLLDLCSALLAAPDTKRIVDIEAPAAFSLAESLGDGSGAVRACMSVIRAISLEQGPPGWSSPKITDWLGRLDQNAKPDTLERAYADMWLGFGKAMKGEYREGHRLLTQAIDLGRRLGDQEILWEGIGSYIGFRSAPQHAEDTIRLTEELWVGPHGGMNSSILSLVWQNIGGAFLASGQRKRAEEVFSELRVLRQRLERFNLWLVSTAMDAVLALIDGRLEEAMNKSQSIRTRGEEAGSLGYALLYLGLARDRALLYLGTNLEALEREHRELLAGVPSAVNPKLCLVLAHTGQYEEASKILDKNVVKRPGISTPKDETPAWIDTFYLEAAVLMGHRQAATLLMNRFNGTNLYTNGYNNPTCIIRHLGGASTLLQRYDEARKHYQDAIKVCTEMRFRPELALSRLQLAELLLEQYPDEKKEALEHLDFAVREFREMKMRPSLESALKLAADQGLHLDSLYTAPVASEVLSGRVGGPPAVTKAGERPIKATEPAHAAEADQLSPREMEILRLVVTGLTNRQIAERLVISLGTVKAHVHNIFEKLHAGTRTQAVRLAREHKLV